MIKLPEQGYTPANYQALVELCQLSNAEFYRTFGIGESTFYKHYAGTRTMKWQEWQQLLTKATKYIEDNIMSNYITCVGRARVNGFSFDVHENKDGSASIRPNKLMHDLPTATWLTYDSVDDALGFIESVCGDLEGVQRALHFWENSGIASTMKEKAEEKAMRDALSGMSEAEKEHYISQKQYEVDEKFIKDSNYFM